MLPVGLKPYASPQAPRQKPLEQLRPGLARQATELARPRRATDPLLRQQDLFEGRTIKLPAVQLPPQRSGTEQLQARQPARKPEAARKSGKPEATQLLQTRDLQPAAQAKPAAAPKAAPAPAAPKAPGALDGLRRRGAQMAGRFAGAVGGAVDAMELHAQLRRIAKPSGLWTMAGKTLGAMGDAAHGAAARFNRFAEGVQTAQRFADGGGKLALPKGGAEAAGREGGAANWRQANAVVSTANDMMGSLAVADDDKARAAAMRLAPMLMDHAQGGSGADAKRALRSVADAASALGAAREPADAAQAARSLRSAGKQVRQLFVERGGGAGSMDTDQAAALQRLGTVVRTADEAADAFKRGSLRNLAAIGTELANVLSGGGDGQAAQALALRDRTQELLSAQAGGNEPDATTAAKRLHVAIRQAQAGAQWERERLLQTLDRAA